MQVSPPSALRIRIDRVLARPVLVLVGSLGLAVLATWLSWRIETSRRDAVIESAVSAQMATLDAQVAAQVALLRATRAFFLVEGALVDAARFRAFVDNLRIREQYPGIQGIGWSPRVSNDSEFRIVFLEPDDARNRAAIGFDMHSEPVRAEAMDRARDTGLFAMTAPVLLKQEIDEDKRPGFLLFTPVFSGNRTPATVEERRRELRGYVYAAFRAGDFFGNALPDSSAVRVATIRSQTARYEGPLFDAELPDDLLTSARTLAVGGQTWLIRFAVTSPQLRATAAGLPAIVFAAGLTTSLLLFQLATLQSRRRRRAEARARDMAQQVEFAELLIGIVSHDLRNPLNVIRLNAALLERAGLPVEALRCVRRIEASTSLSMRLIRDLLDFTRARLGGGIAIVRTPGDITPVVQQAVDEAKLSHPQRAIEFEAHGDGTGTWDADRVSQLVANLLANAIVYGAANAPVRVSLDSRGAEVDLEVHNEGTPIPPAVLPTLFQPFRQHDAAAGAARRNIGLGLYIVRAIAQAHGGTVHVSSTAQAGTSFRVRLPRG